MVFLEPFPAFAKSFLVPGIFLSKKELPLVALFANKNNLSRQKAFTLYLG
jgi:hypothetical protein